VEVEAADTASVDDPALAVLRFCGFVVSGLESFRSVSVGT
jgi:hypothetical protein